MIEFSKINSFSEVIKNELIVLRIFISGISCEIVLQSSEPF